MRKSTSELLISATIIFLITVFFSNAAAVATGIGPITEEQHSEKTIVLIP